MDNIKQLKPKRIFSPYLYVITFLCILTFSITAFVILHISKVKIAVFRVIEEKREDVINGRGFIIRDEAVFKAKTSGYINYYVNPLSIVGKKDIVYSIDKTGNVFREQLKENKNTVQPERLLSIFSHYNSDTEQFSSIYRLKEALKEVVFMEAGSSAVSGMKEALKNYGDSSYFQIDYSTEGGVVVFGTDGYEGIKAEDLKAEVFENEVGLSLPPGNSEEVTEGTPIYKLIKSEDWQVVLPIKEEQAEKLEDRKAVLVSLNGLGFKAKAEVETYYQEGQYYLLLSFYNYMVNFADKRFLDVYIKLDSLVGLKIAKSAVINKKFFLIPSDFLVKRKEDSLDMGVNLMTFDSKGKVSMKFVKTQSFAFLEDYHYLEAGSLFEAGDRIAKIRDKNIVLSNEDEYTFTISKSAILTGVYSFNNGFPEFKRIEEIADIDSDYQLVSDKTEQGLSNYDNIILNPTVVEGDKDERD